MAARRSGQVGGRRLRAAGVALIAALAFVAGCGSETKAGTGPVRPNASQPTVQQAAPTAAESVAPGSPSRAGNGAAAEATPPGTSVAAPPAAAPGSRYLTPTTRIAPASGCTRLTPGMNGIKVKMVQRRLGFPAGTWETMDPATVAAVTRFQQRAGIQVDGVVGPQTWAAMGFGADFCFDRYQAAPALQVTASAAARVRQMIAFAEAYLGEEYVWGGAGPRGYGVDCSGLILQALYSAGLDPQPITVDKHVLPAYRTSRELYAHPRLRHLPLGSARRGDLVFWRDNAAGRVNHIAIYLGNGQVLEAIEPSVHVGRLTNRATQTMMPDVVRPF